MKILWGDGEQLHREGVQRFLLALAEGLRAVETLVGGVLWQRCYAAASEVTQAGASIETVAYTLVEAWEALLQMQWKTESHCTELQRQLGLAREDVQRYRSWWETLRDATSTAQLHAWQAHAATLEQELAQARATCSGLEARLAEQQQALAARETTIAELHRIIARQHVEFDTLFGTMEDLDGAA